MSDFCENCNPHSSYLTPHIIPPPLVSVWLIFDLQKHVNWLCLHFSKGGYLYSAGVNILPKEQIFSPMLPSCDHKVSPFLPQFCDYMWGSVATKPLTAWGPGDRLRAPGGVQGQSPWWGSRGQRPRKLQGFSQFNILRNSLQRALS